jgi:hypothetical protein
MAYRLRARTVVLSLAIAVVAAPLLSIPIASADAAVSLTKDVTVAAPPSSSFAGANSGDGWDVLFYGDRIFNVFHHGGEFRVDCHEQSDGSHCDTVSSVSPWPKTVVSTSPASEFTTPAHSSGWIDASAGVLYAWASRVVDGTGGMVCVDLTSSAANPACGFTELTDPGANPETDTTAFGGRAKVGDQMLAYDPTIQKMLCFSTATGAACPGQPFDISIGGITPMPGGWSDTGNLAASGKVFVHVADTTNTGGVMTCFDPQTSTTCAGSWPQLVSDSYPGVSTYVAAPFPFLSAGGTATGVCLPYDGVVPCWDVAGASIATPPALVSALGVTDMWNEGAVLGTRVFVATGEAAGFGDAVFCYDFATGAGCPNFPIQTSSHTYLYTVTPDPSRPGCMWINADGFDGVTTQIRTFDGFTGNSGCSDSVRVTSSVVIPDAGCDALGWTSVQVLDPPPTSYASATLALTDLQGVAIAGGGSLPADAHGTFDLTGLTIPTSVLYTATFTGPTFSSTGVVFRFTWDSEDVSTCTENATRVSGPPTIDTVTPEPSEGGLTAAITPPTDTGTSPVISYLYSTDGGTTWRERTDGGTAATSLEITQASADGTALVGETVYDIVVRAVSDVGTGLASNSVAAMTPIAKLLHAPASAHTAVGRADALSPVYIAGFVTDVTIDATTTIGTIAVVGNAGLSVSPCTACSGSTIAFSGPQNAVNVALATLTETAMTAGSGTVSISVTRVADLSASKSATINVVAQMLQLPTPAAPTISVLSPSAVNVSFAPIANAVSYTLRMYRADGTTPVGLPRTNFSTGTRIPGLDPQTTYRFGVTAIGDATTYVDSEQSPLAAAKTSTPPPPPAPPMSCNAPRPSQELTAAGSNVYVVGGNRHLTTAPAYHGTSLNQPLIGAVATPSGRGSFSLAADGGVFTAGDARFAGSLTNRALSAPASDIAATPCAAGYDILATDGALYTFGRAHFYGSMGGKPLNTPMTGLAVTCSGRGYYMVGADGGVFTFGNARFHGSLARLRLKAPIVAIVTNCTDTGYWLLAADGGVFAFGNAGFYGSLGAASLRSPIVALLPTPAFRGYWLVAADGRAYPFGDARR